MQAKKPRPQGSKLCRGAKSADSATGAMVGRKIFAFPFDSAGRRLHFLRHGIFCGMDFTSSRWLPIVLLTISNIFMTFAWYGYLKFKTKPLLLVILAS